MIKLKGLLNKEIGNVKVFGMTSGDKQIQKVTLIANGIKKVLWENWKLITSSFSQSTDGYNNSAWTSSQRTFSKPIKPYSVKLEWSIRKDGGTWFGGCTLKCQARRIGGSWEDICSMSVGDGGTDGGSGSKTFTLNPKTSHEYDAVRFYRSYYSSGGEHWGVIPRHYVKGTMNSYYQKGN